MRELPQQKVEYRADPLHAGGRPEGELPEPDGYTGPTDIRAREAGGGGV